MPAWPVMTETTTSAPESRTARTCGSRSTDCGSKNSTAVISAPVSSAVAWTASAMEVPKASLEARMPMASAPSSSAKDTNPGPTCCEANSLRKTKGNSS